LLDKPENKIYPNNIIIVGKAVYTPLENTAITSRKVGWKI